LCDLDRGAYCHGVGAQAAINLHIGAKDRIARASTSAGTTLAALPPFVMIGMDADRVTVVKGFALSVDRIQRNHYRGQCIDAKLRRATDRNDFADWRQKHRGNVP
jgi:hypothetical protein